jgi:hypothetical protein
MTNKEVTDLNQKATVSGQSVSPMTDRIAPPWRAWYATMNGKSYAAVFNLDDATKTLDVPWGAFHISDKPHAALDVWNGKQIPAAKMLHVELPPHGCALFRAE